MTGQVWPRVSQHDTHLPGAFGQVRLATCLATKKVYAVKVADVRARTTDPNHTPISTKRRNTIQREIEMWTLASQAEVSEITKLVEPRSRGFEHCFHGFFRTEGQLTDIAGSCWFCGAEVEERQRIRVTQFWSGWIVRNAFIQAASTTWCAKPAPRISCSTCCT